MSSYHKIAIEDIMGDRFGRYSKYIIQERALPDVRDGLKPVQRRILYAMHHDGNHAHKPYRKSAKTVGLVIGNYHPHGDISVYDAMVRLSQDWKMNFPLVDMQGNNGSIDDDPAAAMRYTEARLAPISEMLLESIEEDVVPFVLNFDDEDTEPSVLPARFPQLLVNGSSGIAAGYATNIPPFNLGEVIDGTIHRLRYPQCHLESIQKIIKGPDFPTGAIVEGRKEIDKLIEKGKARLLVRAKAEIVSSRNKKQIVITELPYDVVKAQLVRKIDELRFKMANDGLGDITDVRDESDRTGLRIVIDCKADADAESILNLLYKHTELQVYFNANMVAIVDQRPQLCGVIDVLDAFIAFREEVVMNRSKYRFNKLSDRLHIVEGLMKASDVLEEVIQIIRASKNRKDAYLNLMDAFDFTQRQAEAIVDLRLYRLSSTDMTALKKEAAELSEQIGYLKLILEDENERKKLMITELQEIKKQFSSERKTELRDEIRELEVDRLSLIPEEEVMISISKQGYVKRSSMRSYSATSEHVLGLREDDQMVLMQKALTTDTLIFFTDQGRYGQILIHELDELRWQDVGNHLNHYVKLNPQEKIVSAMVIDLFDEKREIVTVSREGMIKRSMLSDFELKRTGQLSMAMNLDKKDELVTAHLRDSIDKEVLLLSHEGYALRFSLDEVNVVGTRAKGVIGMRVDEKDYVVDMTLINDQKDDFVFVSDRNELKRVKKDQVNIQNRATKGQRIARYVKSNPHTLQAVYLMHLDETMMFYKDEHMQLCKAVDVPIMKLDATFSNVLDDQSIKLVLRRDMNML